MWTSCQRFAFADPFNFENFLNKSSENFDIWILQTLYILFMPTHTWTCDGTVCMYGASAVRAHWTPTLKSICRSFVVGIWVTCSWYKTKLSEVESSLKLSVCCSQTQWLLQETMPSYSSVQYLTQKLLYHNVVSCNFIGVFPTITLLSRIYIRLHFWLWMISTRPCKGLPDLE